MLIQITRERETDRERDRETERQRETERDRKVWGSTNLTLPFQETFTLHIRGAGGWTNKLYTFFEEEYKIQESAEERKYTSLQKIRRFVTQLLQS